MKVCEFLTEDRILTALTAGDKEEVLARLAQLLAHSDPAIDRLTLEQALCEREWQSSTALGEGVAVPHARLPKLARSLAAFARCDTGTDFDAPDGKPTYFFFVLVSPAENPGPHLKVLARISRLLIDPQFRARSMQAGSERELFGIFREADERLGQQLRAA